MTDSAVRDYTQSGPQVGDVFPDVTLPDQTGALVNLHEARHGKRAIVVFHRSARW